MAKVSLRIYNREIERLIEQGVTDEAIAHCRHILKTFPKHLETYRLLGKAFLESKRYNEAVDVFGRVLMSVPDDFVAHVGLSIVRDEENKLDDSIWHMERAFEAQPSNAAIQGELQRLYGRRDGMEPPKIRMTRGALAHMYVQGELYPQAIAEIRAVLALEPQRSDMQVLLAISYFKGGQKSDASDICNQLLKRYPYSFDANRIMVDLIPATAGAAESTQVYRMRVGELDPYAIFVKGSVFQISEVPDASINLERLEYSAEDSSETQEWSSALGSGFDASAAPMLATSSFDDQPDWLKSSGFSEEAPRSMTDSFQSSSQPASAFEADADIPDFLRAAGWGESNTPEQPTSMFDDDEPTGNLAPADLPDWLKGQAPVSDDLARITTPRPQDIQPMETPDWLSGLGGEAVVPDLESQQEAQPASDIPDWLRAAQPKQEPAPTVESLGSTAQEQDDAVAWLESLAAKHGAKPEELVTDPSKRFEKPPAWVEQAQNIGQQQTPTPQASVQDLGSTAQEQDDAVAWLESLAAKHGAKPEELVTDPSKRSDIAPEWVQQAQSIGESQAAASAEEPAASAWVEGAQNIGEQFFAEFETGSSAAPATDETGMWLRGLGENEKQQEQPEDLSPAQNTDLPSWLSASDEVTPAQETPFEKQSLENQDLSSWLSGLDDEPGLAFDPEIIRGAAMSPIVANQPGLPIETQPAKTDLPDWLSGLDSEQESEDESWKQPAASIPMGEPVLPSSETPLTLATDLPDWLQGMDEATSNADEQASDDDSAPWLKLESLEAEATLQQPTPTSPSDWHTLEEKSVEDIKPDVDSNIAVPKAKPATTRARTQPIVQYPPSPRPGEAVAAPAVKKKPGASTRQPKVEGAANINSLNQAKSELDRGDIPTSLAHYGKLIKKGKHLEETIRDLRESIYRYPVEVGIWQTLGDAYMRANRLKEALDAYNKAEELIR